MNKKSSIIGIGLILLGIAVFLKNIGIMPQGSFMLFAGIFFFYLYIAKKQQAFLVIGLIAALSGSVSIFRDLNFLRFNMTGEIFLFLLGIIFILLYYSKRNIGFLIPGAILISLGCYVFLMDNFNSARLWPSFFVLIGIAFYFIYFLALYGKENWPLVIGTILILMGLIFLAYSYGILDLRIWQYNNYVLPLVLILVGVLLLIKKVKK
mgnify:CR=1 FL=1